MGRLLLPDDFEDILEDLCAADCPDDADALMTIAGLLLPEDSHL